MRLSRDLKWQRSSLLVILPHFQRATVKTKLNLEIRLYQSQLSLVQTLAWHKRRDIFFPSVPSPYIHEHPSSVVPDLLGQAVHSSNSKLVSEQAAVPPSLVYEYSVPAWMVLGQ